MSNRPTILIASNTKDRPNIEPVLTHLEQKRQHVIVYDALAVLTGNIQFSTMIDEHGPCFVYDDTPIKPSHIGAAWMRRAKPLLPAAEMATELRMQQERAACQDLLWRCIPEKRWLNSPQRNRAASSKLWQFEQARQVGLRLPKTLVSNNWQEVIDTFSSDKIIYKMTESGRLPTAAGDTFVYTHVFNRSLSALPTNSLPFPGIWQEYVPKKREWRVTIAGERAFPVAIYTSTDAKDDWRRLQTDEGHVQFKAHDFPAPILEQCHALLKRLNLRFGAFDFIETPRGDYVFLEVNPNGQFLWLLQHGVPIAEAIADELIAIAGHQPHFDR